jgi:hypothetical protein
MDLLAIWGITRLAGAIVKPILEDLAKDTGKDFAKDFFKDALKKVIEPNILIEAYGKALKEFLQLMEQELIDTKCREEQIREYIQPLKQFVLREDVKAALGRAFQLECRSIDTSILSQAWQDLTAPSLPEDFCWELVGKRYVRAIKEIINESEKLQSIYAAQAAIATTEGIRDLVGITPEFDLRKYAEGLREQYGNLRIESLDTDMVDCKLKLEGIFVPQNVRECQEYLPQVYGLPKEYRLQLRNKGQVDEAEIAEAELDRKYQAYQSQVLRSILEIVAGNSPLHHVVILGDPGAGKSSVLQYIALIWAGLPIRDLVVLPMPLLVELRTYSRDRQAGKCQDILTFLHSGNITCRLDQQQLHDKLKAGHAIALFDGIDEVFDPALREEVVTDIHRFTNDYPQVRVIATSRWLGYKVQKLRGAGFQHFMLQDLECEQIEGFIQRWHDLTSLIGVEKERKRDRLQKAIRESKSIRELAGNPLLLTMMAILNRKQELPRDRPELYERASEVLLDHWDMETKSDLKDLELKDWGIEINLKDKQAMLRKVAHHMQSSENGLAGNIISNDDLENILTNYLDEIFKRSETRIIARKMIKQLHHRNFVLCHLGADYYAFVHRTFLEFFCAWNFVWQFEKEKTLTVEQLKDQVFASHWQDESWHEVLRLISGMIDAKFVAEMIDYLLSQQVDKSMYSQRETLVQQRTRGRKTALNSARRQALKRRNEEWIEMSNLFLAANCFVEVRNKQTINSTSDRLINRIKHEIEKDNSCPIGVEMAAMLVSLLATIWKENNEILPYLKKCLNTSVFKSNSVVRRAAIQSIYQIQQNDSSTLDLIRYHAKNDSDSFIRSMASKILIESFQENSDALDTPNQCVSDVLDIRFVTPSYSSQSQKSQSQIFDFLYDITKDNDKKINPYQAALKAINKDQILTVEWWRDEVFAPYWQNESWHEMLRLISGMIDAKFMAEIIDYLLVQQVDKSVYLQKETLLQRKTGKRKNALNIARRKILNRRNEEWIEMSNLFLAAKCFAEVRNKQIISSTSIQLMRRIQSEIEKSNFYSIGVEMAIELVFLFSTIWQDNDETLPYLKKCLTMTSVTVRRAAIHSISQICQDDPDILLLLRQYQYDDILYVQLTAAQSQEDRSQILDFLYNLDRDSDERINPRQAALKAIVENYPDRPEVLNLLLDRSNNDPDEQVRKYAEEQLVIWRARTA